jgi:inorganic triphosphatase YgiF
MAPDRETELKLDVKRDTLPRLEASELFTHNEAESKSIPSVYFDTDGLDLHKAGLSLRVRQTNGTYLQTIKADFGNPLVRGEWEQPIKGPNPDLAAAHDTPLRRVLKDTGETVKPIFETCVERSVRRLERAGCTIEMALDKGEIRTGDRNAPLCELELELKEGTARELFELARKLNETVPLLVSMKSKAERGYAILEEDSPKFEKALPVHVSPICSAGQAFQLIARACIRQILANRTGTLAGDTEALHQMRIGLRRLRTAISLFDEVVADDRREATKQDLKWITEELGPPRDLDVLQTEVLDPLLKAMPSETDRAEVQKEFKLRRQQAHDAAAHSIESDRFVASILAIVEWIEAGSWTLSSDPLIRLRRELPIDKYAADELARRRKKIRKQGKHLRTLSTKKRHKLRISAKKLRYASEFFEDVFPGKKNKRHRKSAVEALKDLQSALGQLNDVAARERMMSDVAKQKPISEMPHTRSLSFAAGIVYGSQEARIEELLAEAQKAHAKFDEIKAFWK